MSSFGDVEASEGVYEIIVKNVFIDARPVEASLRRCSSASYSLIDATTPGQAGPFGYHPDATTLGQVGQFGHHPSRYSSQSLVAPRSSEPNDRTYTGGRMDSYAASSAAEVPRNAHEVQAAESSFEVGVDMRSRRNPQGFWKPYANEDMFESCQTHLKAGARQTISQDAFQDARGSSPQDMSFITTLMIKNIPCKLTVQRLEEDICQMGFYGTYDFMHVPMRKNRSNLSYAFVNFVSVQEAHRFASAFEGYSFAGINSSKRCHIVPAEVQGLEANRAHLANGRYAW